MTTRIAWSAAATCRILMTYGIDDVRELNRALDTIPQPTNGYYYPSDVYEYLAAVGVAA